jgi:hypothetical protein
LPWALRTGIDETAALILQEFLDGVSKKKARVHHIAEDGGSALNRIGKSMA